MKKCVIICIFVMLVSIFFTGCNNVDSDDGANAYVYEQTKETSSISHSATFWDLPELWYNAASKCKIWALFAIGGSWITGCAVMEIFRKTKEIKQWSRNILIFKIPGFIFLFVYVYSFLYGVFNFGLYNGEIYAAEWYNIGIICKRWTPVIVCGSWILGWIVIEVFRKSKEIQKWTWMVMIFKLPGITILIMYLYCLLYGVFKFVGGLM